MCRAGPRPDHFTPISRNRPMGGRLQTPSPRRFHSAGNKPPVAASLSTALHAEVLGTSNYHYTLKPSAYIRRLRTGYCAAQSICRSGTRLWTVPFFLQPDDRPRRARGWRSGTKNGTCCFRATGCIIGVSHVPTAHIRIAMIAIPFSRCPWLLGGLQQALLNCLAAHH